MFTVILDILEGVLLTLTQWALCPISSLMEWHGRRTWMWLRVLSRGSLYAQSVRGRLCFKLGQFDEAITLYESVTASLEDQMSARSQDREGEQKPLELSSPELFVFSEL